KQEPLPIAVSQKDVTLKLHAGGFMTTILTINVDGKKLDVLPMEYQLDPVRDFLLHVDFLRVSRDTLVTVEVPVHFVGEDVSPGIKRGGVLNVVRYAIELQCQASNIPDQIVVDVSKLEIGDTVHISAVTLPEG